MRFQKFLAILTGRSNGALFLLLILLADRHISFIRLARIFWIFGYFFSHLWLARFSLLVLLIRAKAYLFFDWRIKNLSRSWLARISLSGFWRPAARRGRPITRRHRTSRLSRHASGGWPCPWTTRKTSSLYVIHGGLSHGHYRYICIYIYRYMYMCVWYIYII